MHTLIKEDQIFHAFDYDTGLRFYTNRSPTVSLLTAGSAQAEEEDDSEEEEEGESHKMMETHSRESRFDKGWRRTTTVWLIPV